MGPEIKNLPQITHLKAKSELESILKNQRFNLVFTKNLTFVRLHAR